MADPVLELRGGVGRVHLLAFLPSAFIFFYQNEGGGLLGPSVPPLRSAIVNPLILLISPYNFNIFSSIKVRKKEI